MAVRTYLPRTNYRPLMAVVLVLVMLCATQAVNSLIDMLSSPDWEPFIIATLSALLGVGLWRLNPAARRFAVLLLWILIVVLIGGVINPFTAGDLMSEGGTAPNVWMLVAWISPAIAASLLVLHILGKYKAEFGRTNAEAAQKGATPKKASIAGAAIGVIVAIFLLVVLLIPPYQGTITREPTREAVNLLAGAKTPSAEYFADKGKWPEKAEEVTGHTSGKYTERIAITAGAGAAFGTFTLTATIKSSGFFISPRLAGRTVQASTSDDGKTWICGPGTPNGVDETHLPADCRP